MKKKLSKIYTFVLLSVGLLTSCNSDDNNATVSINTEETIAIPTSITITETGLYPEGIDYNTITNQFIVGSIVRSEIGTVDPQTGAYENLVTDPGLASVTGVLTDESRNRLYAVSGNLGFSSNSEQNPSPLAYLGVYNLETGAIIQSINLGNLLPEGTPVFANDIAVDTNGIIYVTDSFSPVIYRIDGNSFEASIFINDSEFAPAPQAFGLNGIAFIDGNLIVNKLDDGRLFRIPVSNPTSYTVIDAPLFVGADGLEVTADGDIILVENDLGANPGTHLLRSTDQWDSATEVSSFEINGGLFPATATLASDGNIYVVNAYLGLALGGNLTQETFSILRVQ